MSAQDKLDRRAAKHGLGSDERKRKIQKAKDFFSKPVPTYSKDELRKMGHPVETTDAEVKKKQDFLDRLRGKPPVKKESSVEYDNAMGKLKEAEVSEISQATKQRYTDKVVKKLTTKRGSRDHDAYTGRTYTGRETDDMFHRGAKLDKHFQRVKKLNTKINVPEEKMYSVKYTHPTDKKSGKTTGPLSKAAADKKAAMGNRVDRVGGKYTVIPHVEASGQEFTVVPTKTRDVSQADRLTIAKMDAIMKKRSKDKRQKEQNIHFVKVGDGRDHMIVKTKADKPSDAVKKIKSQYPKDRVRLHKEEVDEATMADRTVLRAVRIAKDMAGNHTGASKRIEKMKKGLSDHPKVKDALRLANEGIDLGEKLERDGPKMPDRKKFDRNFSKRASAQMSKHKASDKYFDKKLADRQALNKKNDPGGAKKGYALSVLDREKANAKYAKRRNESVSSADKKPQNFRDPATGKLKVRMIPVDRDVVRGDDKARVVRKKRFKNMRKEQMATGNSRVGKDGRDAFMKAFKDVQKTAAEIQKKKDADKK